MLPLFAKVKIRIITLWLRFLVARCRMQMGVHRKWGYCPSLTNNLKGLYRIKAAQVGEKGKAIHWISGTIWQPDREADRTTGIHIGGYLSRKSTTSSKGQDSMNNGGIEEGQCPHARPCNIKHLKNIKWECGVFLISERDGSEFDWIC